MKRYLPILLLVLAGCQMQDMRYLITVDNELSTRIEVQVENTSTGDIDELRLGRYTADSILLDGNYNYEIFILIPVTGEFIMREVYLGYHYRIKVVDNE